MFQKIGDPDGKKFDKVLSLITENFVDKEERKKLSKLIEFKDEYKKPQKPKEGEEQYDIIFNNNYIRDNYEDVINEVRDFSRTIYDKCSFNKFKGQTECMNMLAFN